MEHQQQYATLARAAYDSLDRAQDRAAQHEYEVVHEDSDASDARHHTLFKRGGETVLAFRGTDVKRSKGKDLLTDVQLALGNTPKELRRAAQVAQQLRDKHGDLTVVGHSLGGSKALHATKKLGLKSVTFNPYVGPGMRGVHKAVRETGSEAHVHLDDEIGASAAMRLPRDAVVGYMHKTKGHPHGVKHFEAAEGARLSEKRKTKAVVQRVAKIAGGAALAAGAIAGAVAAGVVSARRKAK